MTGARWSYDRARDRLVVHRGDREVGWVDAAEARRNPPDGLRLFEARFGRVPSTLRAQAISGKPCRPRPIV